MELKAKDKWRFWAKIDRRGPDECWEWTGAHTGDGYGCIRKGGRLLKAHRVAWELANGLIPADMCVLHHCDNPSCVNPRHLFLGTNADNTQDMVQKERQARGGVIGNAKLTAQKVHRIRRLLGLGYSQRHIARIHGVTQANISAINIGRSWAWLQ